MVWHGNFQQLICSLFLGASFLANLLPAEAQQIQDNGSTSIIEHPSSNIEQFRDAETLTKLSAEGQVLYSLDRIKLSGYHYCSEAVSLAERGDFRQSIRAATKALYLGQQERNDNLVAASKRDLAIAFSYAGNLDLAAQYARDALNQGVHIENTPVSPIIAGPSLKVLGDVSVRQGNITAAINYYQQAFDAASDKFRPLVQISLANAYLRAGDLESARDQFKETLVPKNSALRQSYLRGKAELMLAEGKAQDALALYKMIQSESKGPDAEYHQLWAQEGIGRSYLQLNDRELARQAYAAALSSIDKVRARFRSEEFKTGLFRDVQKIYDQAILLTLESGDVVAALEISEKSRARALLDIVRGRVELTGNNKSLPLDAENVATIQSALRPNEALVEYHSLEDRLIAWVVRAEGVSGFTIDIPREALVQRIEGYRALILNPSSKPQEEGSKLFQLLLQPLKLKSTERLVIVPHGPLHYFPFQALREGDSYLIEHNALAIVPSASVGVQLLRQPTKVQTNLAAFGNPEITAKYDLPASQREVERLGELFANPRIFLRRDATKTAFTEHAGQYGILHVAAHAEVDPVDPLSSRILFAGSSEGGSTLEAREIFDLNLRRVSLVTLSACESGLGKIASGDEILGFTRSFLSAGASSLIVSLWPVADDATELIMTAFYNDLIKGATLQEAMQTAQITVLRRPRFSHPFFWAPFNLVGDWRQKFLEQVNNTAGKSEIAVKEKVVFGP